MITTSSLHWRKLQSTLRKCGLRMKVTEDGWCMQSTLGIFADFLIELSIQSCEYGQEKARSHDHVVYFPNTQLRIQFDNGDNLLVYPNGHIRWISQLAYQYYTVFCQNTPPTYCQGDLLVFAQPDLADLPHRATLTELLPPNRNYLWSQPDPIYPQSLHKWLEVDVLNLGGNAAHQALGRLRYFSPIPKDGRTVQITTLEKVVINHDPIDDIHPLIHLASDRMYLISKLPGFSDPAVEIVNFDNLPLRPL